MHESNGKPDKLRRRGGKSGIIVNIGVGIMFSAILALTASIIALLNMTASYGSSGVPFDMNRLTSFDSESEVDISDYFVPEFIGISAGGTVKGISAGINIVKELYSLVSPVIYDVMAGECREISFDEWKSARSESSFVYIKYHSPIPYQVIHSFSGGESESYLYSVNAAELFIMPDSGFKIFVRASDGAAYEFHGTYESYFTVNELSEFMKSYRRSFLSFKFTDGTADTAITYTADESDGAGKFAPDFMEPIFTERVRTKNMLVTEKTAALIQNREEDISELLRLMSFNPDKLYTHEESDNGFVYVENHGVMRLFDDYFEYTAVSEGGIELSSGYYGGYDEAEPGISDYIRTACLIMQQVKSLNPHYIGGDADIILNSADSAEDGSIKLSFIYTFDNIRLAGCEPAFEISFFDGRIKSVKLYSVSVRNLGEQYDSLYEQWYFNTALKSCPAGKQIADIRLVYITDFSSESINAVWTAVYRTNTKEE